MSSPVHSPRPEAPEGAPSTSEYGHLLDLVGLILRAPLRRRRLAALVFVLGVLATVAALLLTPRVYVVNARILGQRNLVISSLGNPRRSVPNESDAPTRAASDTILGRDSLVAIIRDADLVTRWHRERPPVLRLKDRAVTLVAGPLTPEEEERALVAVLEKKLRVQNNESIIRISLEWSNPETAYEIVSLAQKNFLSQKSSVEISVISETIGILTVEAERQREAVDAAFTRVVQLYHEEAQVEAAQAPAASAPSAPRPRVVVQRVPAPVPARDAMPAARLEEKRRAIRAIEEPRQRRLAELQAQRERLLLTYTEAHPSVIQVDAEIAAQRVEPQELTALRQEEAELVASLADMASPRGAAVIVRRVPAASSSAAEPSHERERERERDEDPELTNAKAKLGVATRRYEDMMDRIDSARIELHAAQAAFKYRYTIVEPPEVPRKADRPSNAVLAAGGLVLSAALALFAAAAADLASRRFVEAWQVRRRLRVPVLAEVEEP